MLRLCSRNTRRCYHCFSLRRCRRPFSSQPSPFSSQNSIQYPKKLQNPDHVPSPIPLHNYRNSSLSHLPSRTSVVALSTTAFAAAIFASYCLISPNNHNDHINNSEIRPSIRIYDDIRYGIDHSNESIKRIVNRLKQTGVAASVLWKSLWSVLSSAEHEVRTGFELRVAALLADIAAAGESRRAALVGAGGGAVLDWLLETVAVFGDNSGTQAEAARALAYLIADPNVSGDVLGRPKAVPNLLKFIFSAQPHRSKKGRSMLVAAIMDIVTANCDDADKVSLMPSLPGNARLSDIAAAIEVIEEGGLHLDEPHGSEEGEDGDRGMRGIGMKVLGGTTVLGFSQDNVLREMEYCFASYSDPVKYNAKSFLFNKLSDSSQAHANLSSPVVAGLWDDLHCQHVAVPFASWALANWAMASEENRSHIQELDQDGHVVMTALLAPERSVKWHGSLVARFLLEDHKLPLNDSVSDWSSSLLSTVSQASQTEDIPLAQVALSAFLVSIERSPRSQKAEMEKVLHFMREIAKRTRKHKPVQEALAKALESLCTGDMHLSLEESHKWSGILLPWIFGKYSSEKLQSSARKILSHLLEDYGPSSLPISQGWLAIMLTDILSYRKKTSTKKSAQPTSDKVKNQIDQSNILSATQAASQLAVAVVNLAATQLGTTTNSDDTFPLSDLLSLEPFAVPFKNFKKDNPPKINAADSALATLKGIKALTEISNEDSVCQNKIVDFGILCLLRRFLLQDDYEQLTAIEAYDTSRAMEAQEHHVLTAPGESSVADTNDPSSVRVPPTGRIRRHAARLLMILSAVPKVQKAIAADKSWCEWLEDCACGKILGCNDLKIQSYARATLLNIFCNNQSGRDSVNDEGPRSDILSKSHTCSRYTDMIFLINPELPHWRCLEKVEVDSNGRFFTTKSDSVNKSSINDGVFVDSDKSVVETGNCDNLSEKPESCSQSEGPPLDVVFVHGLRGGPFKTWRLSEDKSSTKSGLVEKIDEEAGQQGTFWPGEWLSADFPRARLFSLKYKTNLTQWSGASLPLQEVSSMLLEKLVAAGIGNRPVVFITHSMGGLVVKQILHQAKTENENLVNNTVGVVFYSCPHFGSKLADMPWRMGLVLRPAPSIGELRSGSPRLVELNDFLRHLHKKGTLDVLSFCETKVTPIVEGYGGWAFRMEIVPIESAYPGFGELVVLESTDHVNSCKPLSRSDPSYKEILDFLQKLKTHFK